MPTPTLYCMMVSAVAGGGVSSPYAYTYPLLHDGNCSGRGWCVIPLCLHRSTLYCMMDTAVAGGGVSSLMPTPTLYCMMDTAVAGGGVSSLMPTPTLYCMMVTAVAGGGVSSPYAYTYPLLHDGNCSGRGWCVIPSTAWWAPQWQGVVCHPLMPTPTLYCMMDTAVVGGGVPSPYAYTYSLLHDRHCSGRGWCVIPLCLHLPFTAWCQSAYLLASLLQASSVHEHKITARQMEHCRRRKGLLLL